MQKEERQRLGVLHLFSEAWPSGGDTNDWNVRPPPVLPSDARLIARFESLSLAASTVVILTGLFVLAGGFWGFSPWKLGSPGLTVLKVQAAICFVLSGLALRLVRKPIARPQARSLAQVCALLAALLGMLAFAGLVFGRHFGIDQFFPQSGAAAAIHPPSRMTFLIALNFVLIGCALLLIDVEFPAAIRPAQWLTLLAALTSISVILDSSLRSAVERLDLTLPTAMLFLVLCAGVFLARPDRGLMALLVRQSLGGVVVRHLLPAAIGISVLLGWLRWEGENAGLYGTQIGVILMTLTNLVVVGTLIWWNAGALDRADAQRHSSEQALRQAHAELESRVADRTAALAQVNENLRLEVTERKRAQEAASYLAAIVQYSEDAIIGMSLDGLIESWNSAAQQTYDYVAHEVVGRHVSLLLAEGEKKEIPQILERIRRGERVEHYRTTRIRKDGEAIPVLLTISPVRDAAGEIIGASTIARDISESLRAEQTLQQANTVLTEWLRELEKRNRETTLLNEMSELLQTCVSAEEAYAVIERSVRLLFSNDSGALCVLNSSRNLVQAVATWGVSSPAELLFTPQECWALRRGQAHLMQSRTAGLVCQHSTIEEGASALCVPMMGQGEALGVLYLRTRSAASDPESGLNAAKQQLAATAAGQIGLALANLRLRETLRSQSIRDSLTGLFNRRHMQESLARELRRSARSQQPLGAIMLDMDRFKNFNDVFGHDAGDTLLRELGHFLQTHTRQEDIACRYGGEEFVVILPETSAQTTRQRAESLRDDFKKLDLKHREHSLGSVTLSAGVAMFPQHASTAEDLLRVADRALYRAKAAGRDRVEFAEALA